MSELDEDQSSVRSEAVNHMLLWANRMHPSDQLDRDSISQGLNVAELLCFLCSVHFDEEFLEKVQSDKDTSVAGNVRRNEIIRQQIRNFYLAKCQYDLDNAPLFFFPAAEIVEKNENALMGFMFIIYGIAVVLKTNSTNEFSKLLQSRPIECQEYVKKMESMFVGHLDGKEQTNYAEIAKHLRSKLSEKDKTIVELRDKCSNLEFELTHQKDELAHYAESNVASHELQRKLLESQQLEKQIKDQDEVIRKLEVDLSERNNVLESLSTENSTLKFELNGIKRELRDLKDDKATLENKLSISEEKANEFEKKFSRLRDSEMCPKRDYDALMDRYMANLKIIEGYEQDKDSLEIYRVKLASSEAQLEQMKNEKNASMAKIHELEQNNRDLKKELKEIKSQSRSTPIMNYEPISINTDLAISESGNVSSEMASTIVEKADTESSSNSLKTGSEPIEPQVESILDGQQEEHQIIIEPSAELIGPQFEKLRLESEKADIESALNDQQKGIQAPTSLEASAESTEPQAIQESEEANIETVSNSHHVQANVLESSITVIEPQVQKQVVAELTPEKRFSFKPFLWLLPLIAFLLVRVLISVVYDDPFTLFGSHQRGIPMPFEQNSLQVGLKKVFSLFSEF